MARVLVVTVKPWNIRRYHEWAGQSPHDCHLIDDPKELTVHAVEALAPDYIFFIHWSWKIPAALYTRYECVIFHMTDLPYGRGGSPLQNLILRGFDHTQLSAVRATEDIDSGPVYMKRPLCLGGSATEIYLRASRLAFRMIDEILQQRPVPVPQVGDVVEFRRRTPRESEIPTGLSVETLYDFIRMLDADGYPAAFLQHDGFRLKFSRPSLRDGCIVADVEISRDSGESI